MKKSIPFYLITLSLSLFTYGLHAAEDTHGHNEHGSEAAVGGLSLNNGDRWEMDSHTRKMSSKMEETFYGADHSNQASLNALGSQLEAQLGELIQGCTMSGKSHDQLHVFLTDYIPTINNLAKAKDHETARNTAIKIKGDLEVYKNHFK